ncbi:MAG TPA: Mu transposase C-terminal domain-containing protein [Ensifer sp.]|uniref:Mu transposase C-terminal domain-containing protein n=1 Tax=Ensifer sp. TaxID=1872086 RepID=UPI002E13D1B7|nr:Mu transposase C-terminal domain-containing protein [Ensifer sp.]
MNNLNADRTLRFPKLLLSPQDQVSIGGIDYFKAHATDDGYILRRVDSPDAAKDFSHAAIWHASKSPDWEYRPGQFDPGSVRIKQISSFDSLHTLAEAEATEVYVRWQYVTRVLQRVAEGKANFSVTKLDAALSQIEFDLFQDDRLKMIIERNARRKNSKSGGKNSSQGKAKKLRAGTERSVFERPSARTLLRWLKMLKEGGGVPWALRSNARKSGGGRRLCPKQREFVAQYGAKYATADRPSFSQLHEEMSNAVQDLNETVPTDQQISCPSIDSLKRFVAGLSKFFVCVGRYGTEEAKRRFIWTGQGPDIVRPGQRVEIDHHEIDLMTILKRQELWQALNAEQQVRVARMQLCAALDVATGCVLGACLSETPSAADTLRVLRMSVSDKALLAANAGAVSGWDQRVQPDTVATDGGPANTERNVVFAIHGLKSGHEISPGGLPWLHGTLERFFGTFETKLVSQFSGRTFGSVAKLFNYKSEDLAHLTTDELAELIVFWIVDVYHNTESDGLGGETPARAWKRLTETVGMRPVPDRRTLRAVFGIKTERKLSGEGLTVAGLHYSSEAMGRLWLKEKDCDVEVRFDPNDIGTICFRVGNSWPEARCTEPGFDGVPLAEWSQTVHDLRQTFVADNKITAPVVRRAMRAIREASNATRVRENIATPEYSAEDLARLEDEVFRGFVMPKSPSEIAAGSDDFLGGGYATGGTELTQTQLRVDDEPDHRPNSDSADDFSFEG